MGRDRNLDCEQQELSTFTDETAVVQSSVLNSGVLFSGLTGKPIYINDSSDCSQLPNNKGWWLSQHPACLIPCSFFWSSTVNTWEPGRYTSLVDMLWTSSRVPGVSSPTRLRKWRNGMKPALIWKWTPPQVLAKMWNLVHYRQCGKHSSKKCWSPYIQQPYFYIYTQRDWEYIFQTKTWRWKFATVLLTLAPKEQLNLMNW